MKKLILLLALVFAAPLQAQGVVSAADPQAAEAGRDILRAGGSATDAAIAMMLALTVVEPQSSGIGGGGFLLHHDARSGALATIDGRETAPASAGPKLFFDDQGKPLGFMQAVVGGRSVGIPGNIALAADAHRKWGKLKWARLFDPAIRLADQGYAVTPRLAGVIGQLGRLWGDFPETRAIYWQDGRAKRAGETIRNPALAALLRKVARGGAKAFYSGANARAIITAAGATSKNPTVITSRDVSTYRAKPRDPICGPYRQWKVCGMGPPSSGATTVLQMLGMLERFDLKALGRDNAQSWHLIGEAMLLAYADRDRYLGDPDFVAVSVAGLLDKAYIASRSALISPNGAMPRIEAGTPPGAAKRTAAIPGEAGGTSHFVAVDRAGNIANWTSTIEGPFGSQLVANGYILNNELTDFSFAPERDGAPVANAPAAGKRPLSSMAPTIVYDASGKPVFAVGAAGGKRIIMQVAKTLIAHLDWGMTAADALAAPNIFFGGEALLIEKATPLAAMEVELARFGRTVVGSDLGGKANAAERTASGWVAAADPRSDGVGLGE